MLKVTDIDPDSPILIFDSGIGGLSVLSAVQQHLPGAQIVYAADYAGLPYGTKSEAEIAARVPALLGRLVERYRPAMIVIACNTACTIALSHVRAALNVPVVGTVPAVKPAALATKTGVFGLLGTQVTIRQPYVDQLQAEFASEKTLLRHAAPDLVHAAETKMRGGTPASAVFTDAIAGLRNQPGGDRIDVIILGCTHFPLLQDELAIVAEPGIAFVDGAMGIARRAARLSEGRQWPAIQPAGIFVTTGSASDAKAYSAALARYRLTKIESL
jgi:glutamate racemase